MTRSEESSRFMGHTIQVSEDTLLRTSSDDWLTGFLTSPAAVNTLVRKEHARFETSQIRDFVPLLVEKRARRELKHKSSISPNVIPLVIT
jgi:hypothetical protein